MVNCVLGERLSTAINQEDKNRTLRLTTVFRSGIALLTQSYNALNNAEIPCQGAVLAKPFPCLVSQGFILAFVKKYSQL